MWWSNDIVLSIVMPSVHTTRHWIAISAKCDRADIAFPPLSRSSANDNGFRFVRVESESVDGEPSMNCVEAVVHYC